MEKYLNDEYNKMFEYFNENDLISHNQSGFKPGDSSINQLLSVTIGIYKSFDEGYETRGVFLTYRKSSIKFGTKVSFINLKKTAYQVNY